MSQRRRLRINQSPKPADEEQMKYRESPSTPFRPGFYRKPPEDADKSHVFQLVRRSSSRSRQLSSSSTTASPAVPQPAAAGAGQTADIRISQASSKAYEGDYESEVEERK